MISGMAIVHISEAEASRDLSAVLARVRAGDEVRIDSLTDCFSLMPARSPKKLSEAIAELELRTSTASRSEGCSIVIAVGGSVA
jgi:antitoxin (DNA-binding transcriptional repressor) of toxin-antitoxin stability system